MSRLSSSRSALSISRVALMSALLVPGLLAAPLAYAGTTRRPLPVTHGQRIHAVSAGFHTSVRACAGGQLRGPLHSGQCVLVTATGFLPDQTVVVREYRQPAWRQDRTANGQGVLTLQFRVPPTGNATTDALTFTGIEQAELEPGSGTVAVTVPHAAAYRFIRVP